MKEHSFISKCGIIPLARHSLMQMSMQMSRGTKLDSILGPICPKLTQFVPFLTKNVNFHPVFLPFFGINWDIGPNLPLFNPNCEIFPQILSLFWV